MKDKKDNRFRLEYLEKQKQKQEAKKQFYIDQIKELENNLQENQKQILDNQCWIDFHKNSIKEHEKEISKTLDLIYRQDQEKKKRFHIAQIDKHHQKNIQYHNREIKMSEEEIKLFKKGISKCNQQLKILKNRIMENKK